MLSRLPLTDQLALYRTHLANERTLLSYLRSGLALILAGVTIIQFSLTVWFTTVGTLCIPGGFGVLVFGVIRFNMANKKIRHTTEQVLKELVHQ